MKIAVWNRDTHSILEFETRCGKVEQYGENGITICDTDLKRIAGIIMMIKSVVDVEFQLIYNSWFGEFVECHLTTFDGTIDIQ